jgi:hypothetical protein
VLCLSAGNRKNRIGIVLARAAKTLLSLGAPDCPVVHRTVRWCTGQCSVRQAGSSELAALGNSQATYGYNSSDCPVSQRSAGPTVGRAICAGHVAEPTARRGHRTVHQRLSGCQRSAAPVKERNRALDSVRSAPDCPVRHTTEGKNCLPRLLSTAPSCLGAIKGPPRRMEENTKHPLSTIDHSHIILAHLFDILVI